MFLVSDKSLKKEITITSHRGQSATNFRPSCTKESEFGTVVNIVNKK